MVATSHHTTSPNKLWAVLKHSHHSITHHSWHAGSIFSRSGICEWGGPCGDLQDCDSLVARVLGDGKPYLAVLADEEGHKYKYKISTRLGFSTVRMPFNRFRAESSKSPPMRPGMLHTIKFRCSAGNMHRLCHFHLFTSRIHIHSELVVYMTDADRLCAGVVLPDLPETCTLWVAV